MPVTTLPRLRVFLDGAPLDERDARALSGLHVRRELSAPAQCELTLAEPAGPIEGVMPGAELKIEVEGAADPGLFEGQVTAVEFAFEPSHGRLVRIRGYDPLHKLRKRRAVRAHVQATAGGLLCELASDLGLPIQVEEPGPEFARILQLGQSDLELLVEVAQRSGLYLFARQGELHLATLRGSGEPISLELGSALLEARLELNGEVALRSVSVAAWDPLRVEPHRGGTSDPRLGRDVAAAADPGSMGGTGELEIPDQVLQSDAQADALARAELERRAQREVSFWGIAEGDPRLAPGTIVDVRGVSPGFEGCYVLASVTHTVDSVRGFVSELSTLPPPPRPGPRPPVSTLGIVTRVDDPEGLGRIQVRLPAVGDVETDWLCVVLPGAGKNKGLVAVPDVGDRVLVHFPEGDSGAGLVLGGICGAQPAPEDWGIEGSSVKRFWFLTPGGQKVKLDDESGAVRIENGDGSFLEMTPKRVVLHAARDLTVESPGNRIVLRANAVDFEQG